MNKNLDSINVELVVAACQMETNHIWMQGDLAVRLNGEKPYADSDLVDADELLKSLEQDGEFFIFFCCCGVPQCSGWNSGVEVIHSEDTITWINPNNGKTWCFSRQKIEDDLKEIREELANYKAFFSEKNIEYVGVGYNW
jgi:hypothetical protein